MQTPLWVDATESDASNDSEKEEKAKEEAKAATRRVKAAIPGIRLTKGAYPKIRKVSKKYTVNVIINQRIVPVFADTGADVCIMAKTTADKLKLELNATDMRIRPYGSRPKKMLW